MKLPNITSSIFAIMSKMANDYGAINLFHKYSLVGYNQYAPMAGVPELRERISEKINNLYSKRYNPENEITITSGATDALFTAITAVVSPRDEVIIFEPAYDSYAPVVQINGGKPVFIPLDKKDFSIDWERVKDSLTDKTKLIILNSPHNPTGSVISVDDLHNFEEIARDKELLIISDEVYEHIIFDGIKHVSISESEELSQKAFVISSFGKTFHTTGWKVGKGLDDMAFTRVNNEKIIRLCFAKKDEVLLRAAELIAAS